MKKFEDEKNGLMAIDPDDSNENTLRFGRMNNYFLANFG